MKFIILLIIISFSLSAQERVLLHIDRDGRQEAIPLRKGERALDVIKHHEQSYSVAGMLDTVKNYPGDDALNTNFGFFHQEIAMQWFVPSAGGRVKEFWWRNNSLRGNIKKGTIRAWYVDPRLATRPSHVITKYMGFYKDPSDGDGLVSPFRQSPGDQWYYKPFLPESTIWGFDPLGTEVKTWIPGSGVQVNLDSGKWQGITVEDWGDSIFVTLGQLFGFTLSNDTKKFEIPSGGTDERMELLSWQNTNTAPYHSFKWYENGRTGANDKGWHMRGDYDWGMYAVIEYTTDRPPKINPHVYYTTILQTPRKLQAVVTDDNPGGGPAGLSVVRLHTKKGSMSSYDSTIMSSVGDLYSADSPALVNYDTIFWYISAIDVNGNYSAISPRKYHRFRKLNSILFIYNNAQYSTSIGSLIYTSSSNRYDLWSAPNDGISELPDLLSNYTNVLLADGAFPSRNVYPAISTWLKEGTGASKKQLFFTSQDYGCFITDKCFDTTFGAMAWERIYLGIETLGPQDQGPFNRPIKVVPKSFVPFGLNLNSFIKYNADSATSLWYYPTFELAFSAYPDFMTIAPDAKAVFVDATGANVFGVQKKGSTTNTVFLAFDAGALQFRSDTSLHDPTNSTVTDPKYRWIVDYQALANTFFFDCLECNPNDTTTSVQNGGSNPYSFVLEQNYPNPFNPITDIGYEVQYRTAVSIIVYNALGQNVMTVVNTVKDPGRYTASFDGRSLSSGIYFYEMRAGSFVSSKKMLLLK